MNPKISFLRSQWCRNVLDFSPVNYDTSSDTCLGLAKLLFSESNRPSGSEIRNSSRRFYVSILLNCTLCTNFFHFLYLTFERPRSDFSQASHFIVTTLRGKYHCTSSSVRVHFTLLDRWVYRCMLHCSWHQILFCQMYLGVSILVHLWYISPRPIITVLIKRWAHQVFDQSQSSSS